MEKTTRDQIQAAAIEAVKEKRRVILNWGTGVGKSRVAVKCSQWVVNSTARPNILLVVQETAHKSNWRNEFVSALGFEEAERVLSYVYIDCYASLKNHECTAWDLIIFDEGHHLRSELRRGIFRTIKSDRVLLLSATISDGGDGDEMLADLNITFGDFVTYEFKMQNAIDNGFLGKPEINVIPVVLTPDQKQEYDNLNTYQDDKKKEYFQARYEAGLEYGDKRETVETEQLKVKWLNSGSRKKRFLGYKKTTVAKRLLKNTLNGSRYVCFCSSVKQVEWLDGKNYVCSLRSAKENREAIEAFNNMTADSLFTVGMLQEGQNLNGIQKGLIIQLDGKERSFVQKFGRVMRAKMPVLYILYIVDTRDEDYLKTALSGINKEYIHFWDPVYTDGSAAPTIIRSEENGKEHPKQQMREQKSMRLPKFGIEVTVPYLFQVSTEHARFTHNGRLLGDTCCGKFLGIAEDTFGNDYVFVFQDIHNMKYFGVMVKKRQSIGILASLVAIKSFTKPITMRLSMKNSFVSYALYQGNNKLNWPQDFMKTLPQETNDRVAALDSLSVSITRCISA